MVRNQMREDRLLLTPAGRQDDAEPQCRFLTPQIAEWALSYWVMTKAAQPDGRFTQDKPCANIL
jgi:hypothetical protein